MDTLAASGVKLENYYVQAVCSPTRAAIMTGRYATHTGIHVPLVDSAPGVLPNDEVLLPALLKKAGYATHMVGKVGALPASPPRTPHARRAPPAADCWRARLLTLPPPYWHPLSGTWASARGGTRPSSAALTATSGTSRAARTTTRSSPSAGRGRSRTAASRRRTAASP
jgi:arylsulfatase A-like enzyme